ncbi:ThiF family adenylyltransferase [Priestia sp. YIM B13551]|uniref:ThiF family adenylyltransferase n=1 Tax=Priestia sp. YIM B13551 TaxID=3366306 RepID=UPI00366CE378
MSMMQLNLEPTLVLNTAYNMAKVFVVTGAGGTGGYFIPNLARQIAITNNLRRMERLPEHKLIIVDADDVSLSNLNRQNFIEKDLDKNKAEVLATRYGVAFSTNIQYLDQYVTSTEMLVDIVLSVCDLKNDQIPVLVDCVDNNKTRVFIHEAVEVLKQKLKGVYSLSSGNEFLNGQVVCGFTPGKTFYSSLVGYENNRMFCTPTAPEMFPEILEGGDKLPTELSCDEAAVSHPQNIMTNITAANILFNFANILLTAKVDNEELPGLTHFAVTFDTQKGTYRTFLNKENEIKRFLNATNGEQTSVA